MQISKKRFEKVEAEIKLLKEEVQLFKEAKYRIGMTVLYYPDGHKFDVGTGKKNKVLQMKIDEIKFDEHKKIVYREDDRWVIFSTYDREIYQDWIIGEAK